MKIQGYAFGSDIYCIACAQAAWVARDLSYPRLLTMAAITKDENGIPMGAVDFASNTIVPVFESVLNENCQCEREVAA